MVASGQQSDEIILLKSVQTENYVIQLVKSFLIQLNRLNVRIPRQLATRVVIWDAIRRRTELLDELFLNCGVLEDPRGFWSVTPMPARSKLDEFYRQDYWASRNQQSIILTRRDIAHFEQFRGYLAEDPPKPLRVLNFGSGHGGISFLMSALGHSVVNVDPFTLDSDRFEHKVDLEEVQGEFDLVYSSHSLEHVTNIDSTLRRILELLKPGGIFFVEVPNSEIRGQQDRMSEPPNSLISPPHTYYFTRKFFADLGLVVRELSIFEYHGNEYGRQSKDMSGEVIRFIGEKTS